jgi:hypothetical protein
MVAGGAEHLVGLSRVARYAYEAPCARQSP